MDAKLLAGEELARIVTTAMAWELAVFSAYLFNGVMDVHEDRVNRSRRPIARGALSTRHATRIAAAMSRVTRPRAAGPFRCCAEIQRSGT